jgi:hypothetical protein
LAESLLNLATAFTLNRAEHADDLDDDLRYFSAIAPYYSAIFANSVSVGNLGREVYSEKLVPYVKPKKQRKNKKEKPLTPKQQKKAEQKAAKEAKKAEKKAIKEAKKAKKAKKVKIKKLVVAKIPESKKVLFNVCSKQMHSFCDVRYKDCSTCELNQEILTNDLEDFAKGVKGYFKETEKYLIKLQKERFSRQIDDTISSDSASIRELASLIDHTQTVSKEATKKLNTMLKKKVSYTAPFFAEFDDVSEIKDMVQSIQCMVFKKYFEQIKRILTESTDAMKRSISTIGQAAKNSLNTSQIGGKHGIN